MLGMLFFELEHPETKQPIPYFGGAVLEFVAAKHMRPCRFYVRCLSFGGNISNRANRKIQGVHVDSYIMQHTSVRWILIWAYTHVVAVAKLSVLKP